MFRRIGEVDRAWIQRDFHLHTKYTDGKPEVAEVIRRCEELGLSEIAFTEHVRRDSAWFPRFAAEVRGAAARTSMKVLVGCEARIADAEGNLDVTDEIRAHCDVILAAVHRFPDARGEAIPFSTVPRDRFAQIEHDLAMAFLRRGGGHALAHPGGMSLRYAGGFPDELHRSLMVEAKARGIAIELNAQYMADFTGFLALVRQVDPLISVGSDAHTLAELGACRDRLSALLFH